ncbi:MAG: type II toxin-antitoxin system RelE/ParE family toxin [Planctomycetota bacterium]
MTIEYHPAVQPELEEVRQFYEGQLPGLGWEFIDEFERQALRIASTPLHWMVVNGDVRRCLMKRFPYIIYFRQVGPERIRITVVKHARRHPRFGRNRA